MMPILHVLNLYNTRIHNDDHLSSSQSATHIQQLSSTDICHPFLSHMEFMQDSYLMLIIALIAFIVESYRCIYIERFRCLQFQENCPKLYVFPEYICRQQKEKKSSDCCEKQEKILSQI